MSQKRVRTEILGHESRVQYSGTWAGYALVSARVAIGWLFFDAGVSRLTDPTWSVAQFGHVTSSGSLAGLWTTGEQSVGWLVGLAIVWGLVLVGAMLIFGAAVRLGAGLGAAIVALLWTADLPIGSAPFVDLYVVYVLVVLFGLAAFGAGRIAGLDAYFESHPAVAARPWLQYVLG